MKTTSIFLTAFICASCVAESPSDAVASPPSEPALNRKSAPPGLMMVEKLVKDPGMNNAVAFRLLIPQGWKLEGGLQRPTPQAYNNPVLSDLNIKSPDGRGLRLFPRLAFEYRPAQPQQPFSPTANGNFYYPMPNKIADWLVELQRTNPAPGVTGFKLVSTRVLPDETKALQRQTAAVAQIMAQSNAMGAQFGMRQSFKVEAVEIVARYKENGKVIEETIHLAWSKAAVSVQGQLQSAYWGVEGMRSIRGPVNTNYLDDPALQAVASSIRADPKWVAQMQQYFANLSRIRHRGNMQRHRANAAAHQKRMQTLNETNDILHQGFRSRSKLSDRGQQKLVDAIHEQTPYVTPDGGQVKLPSFYSHVYSDGNGRYLLSNDALNNPNTGRGHWTRLKAGR